MKQFNFRKIKEYREAAELTQEGLAIQMSLLGDRVYPQQISDWENKKEGGLNVSNLAKLAHVLNKATDDFFMD